MPTRKSDAYRHSGKTLCHLDPTAPTAATPSNRTLGVAACRRNGGPDTGGIWGQNCADSESGSEDVFWVTFSSGLVLNQITSKSTGREYRRVRAGRRMESHGNYMYHSSEA